MAAGDVRPAARVADLPCGHGWRHANLLRRGSVPECPGKISAPLALVAQTNGPRSVQKFERKTSRRFAIVEVEHPTESLVPADHPNFLYRARHRPDQPIVQPLMISLPVVMVHVFGHGTA